MHALSPFFPEFLCYDQNMKILTKKKVNFFAGFFVLLVQIIFCFS